MDENINRFGCQMTVFPEVNDFRLPVGVSLTVYVVIAYLLQILVLIILTVLRRRLKIPIYKLMNQLNMSQMISMSSYLTLVLPCTYTTCSFYSNTINILLTLPQIFGHYTALTMNALIAIERISVFVFPPIHNFVEQHSVLYTSAAWSVGCLIIVLTTGTRCFKRYSPYTIRYTYECGSCEIFPGFTVMTFLLWFTEIMVAIMMLGYIIVLIAMKMKRHFHGSAIRFTSVDAQLLFQGALICLFQTLNSIMFFVLPDSGNTGIWSQVIANFVSVTNASIQAPVLLIFNKTVSDTFLSLTKSCRLKVHPVNKGSPANITSTTEARKGAEKHDRSALAVA